MAFEEEEEGIGMTSDVIKVNGDDLANPGSLRGDRARWHVQSWRSISWLSDPWPAAEETLGPGPQRFPNII